MEKAKTDCHDEARDRSLFERFFESLKTYAALSEEPDLSGLGVDSAPNSVFRILGASPKFKIIELYGQVRVIKHYKSDGLVRCAERLPRRTQLWGKERSG